MIDASRTNCRIELNLPGNHKAAIILKLLVMANACLINVYDKETVKEHDTG